MYSSISINLHNKVRTFIRLFIFISAVVSNITLYWYGMHFEFSIIIFFAGSAVVYGFDRQSSQLGIVY